MRWLNYHHLLYFWTVAKEGSIARASQSLRLAQPTISGQIRALEESLGEKLFRREGRRLVLTDVGQVAFRYAEEIFQLGRELTDTLHGRPTGRPMRLVVGVADALPKLIAYRLIEPALRLADPVHVVCREDRPERLLAELASHGVDIVLSDAPAPAAAALRAFNHPLGECGVSFFAVQGLADRLRAGFPGTLDGAPFLLPSETSALRRALDAWFDRNGVRPRIVGEFDDSALLKAFGEAGAGAFAAPSVLEAPIRDQYGVQLVARVDELRERFWAISVERKLQHPAIVAISHAARTELFA